jgi:alpha-N-arabinofuranosidase
MIAADPDGGAYKQVTFYPFQHAATYGNGVTLRPNLETPQITTEHCGDCPAIQSAVVYNGEEGMVTVFAVNMDLRNDIEFVTDLRSFTGVKLTEHIQIHEQQPLAGNTFENPNRAVPKNIPVTGGPVVLPALSWNVLRYKVQ